MLFFERTYALDDNDTRTMQHLLRAGADPNARSLTLATPLMTAVQLKKISHARTLLSSGADVNARDRRGFTALHRAAEMGNAEIVQLLLTYSADPNIEAQGHTPYSLAAERDEKETMKLLQ